MDTPELTARRRLLADERAALDAAARHHKREAARHRRLAQEARQKQAEVEARCRALGIACETVPAPGTD